MSLVVDKLRKMMAQSSKPKIGIVVSSGQKTLQVKTSRGITTILRVDATDYREADEVRIVNGAAVGRVTPSGYLPNYYV